MNKNISYFACHFHKVDALVWCRVRTIVNDLLLARVKAGDECLTICVDENDFDTLSRFIEEMDTAYLHPRRDSAHIHYLSTIYSGFKFTFQNLKNVIPSSASPSRKKPKSENDTLLENEETQISFSRAILLMGGVLLMCLIASHIDYLFTNNL